MLVLCEEWGICCYLSTTPLTLFGMFFFFFWRAVVQSGKNEWISFSFHLLCETKRKQKLASSDRGQQWEVNRLPASPNYSEDLSRTPCQRWPRTDPIWPLAHTRQLLVLVPVKRRSMRPALIVIIAHRLPGTISNPHHLSCRQVHRGAEDPWLLLL